MKNMGWEQEAEFMVLPKSITLDFPQHVVPGMKVSEDKLCDENSAREEDLHYVHPHSHMFPDHAWRVVRANDSCKLFGPVVP